MTNREDSNFFTPLALICGVGAVVWIFAYRYSYPPFDITKLSPPQREALTQLQERCIVDLQEFRRPENKEVGCIRIGRFRGELKNGAGETFSQFDAIKSLEQLYVVNDHFDDSQAHYLNRLEDLTWLDIRSSTLTDAALPQIAELKRLKHLHLDGCTKLTGNGVQRLVALSSLKVLTLPANKSISSDDIASLKKAIPKCEINQY